MEGTAERPATTSTAVWMQRRKGETKTRWIGNATWELILWPVWKARTLPSWMSGGSHGLSAVEAQSGSKRSIRSPWRITMTFWWPLMFDLADSISLLFFFMCSLRVYLWGVIYTCNRTYKKVFVLLRTCNKILKELDSFSGVLFHSRKLLGKISLHKEVICFTRLIGTNLFILFYFCISMAITTKFIFYSI